VEFLKNRFEEKGFARGAGRVQIAACRELGLKQCKEYIKI